MALYTPCLGETPDGKCSCGQPATTEVQAGWHNAGYQGAPFGGQYEEVCEECYRYQMDDSN